jgi:hypothetical protein
MPFAFLILGSLFVAAGVRGQSKQLLTLLHDDLTGPNNYIYWMLSILILGALGYIDALRPLSRAFLVLVIVVLVLKEGNPNQTGGGFFQQFQHAISKITSPTATGISDSTTGGVMAAQGIDNMVSGATGLVN